jgi:photosystem II stability/assembly factor-like uncharacterized protein
MSLSRQTRVSLTLLIAAFFLLSTNYFAFDETYYSYPNPSLWTQAGWTQPHESNPAFKSPLTQEALNSVHFVDTQNGWAVGRNGTILHTSNAGASWQSQTSPSGQYLASVHFADSKNGWAVGLGGLILNTSNGGSKWKLQYQDRDLNLGHVFFYDSQNGWAVGSKGTILHTSDAGANWRPQPSGVDISLAGVHFTDSQNGWAVGSKGTILHTVDAGANWRPQDSKVNIFLAKVHFVDSQNGWAVGDEGTILHTSDAGAKWLPQYREGGLELVDVQFADPQNGWAVGYHIILNESYFNILRTTDGGAKWLRQRLNKFDSLNSVHFSDSKNGWAVGSEGNVFRSSNGGETWQLQSSSRPSLRSVHFTDAENGWIVGTKETILRTANSGTTWQQQKADLNISTTRDFNDVHFVNNKTGWVVGSEGTILRTSDSGQVWLPHQSANLAGIDFNGVHFVSSGSGWVVGNDGSIFSTSDGGTIWNLRDRFLGSLSDIYFTSEKNGWATGYGGPILHTTDSGVKWQTEQTGIGSLNAVHFPDSENGWAVGNLGSILHPDKPGEQWRLQTSGSQILQDVHFPDSQSGWAVGANGTILHTSNAGKLWQSQPSLSIQYLYGVHFTDPQNGWAVGDDSTILQTSNAGATWQQAKLNTRWPAPIYWPISSLCLISLVLVLRPNQPRRLSAIDVIATSDSPVTSPSQDLLGRASLANRLFRFLSNSNTKPPFCLSIEAPWGHGKSSIMGMLESLLTTQKTAATVWFNAWHHRKEDSLLAFLLEAIKKQSVPKDLAWINFARKLLWLRAQTPLGLLFLLGLGFVCCLFYFRATPTDLPPWLDAYEPWLKKYKAWRDSYQPTLEHFLALAALFPGYQILLKSFRIDPEKLLTATKDSLRLADLRGKTDVRAGFLEELSTVIQCLPGKRLVIFLDDLDRCPPDHIVEMLEAVNFLSGASNCIFVLGIDRHYVETAVGLHYEKIAAARSPKLDPTTARNAFAKSYLEKIINITVGLPDLQASDVGKMLNLPPQPKPGAIGPRRAIIATLATIALTLGSAAFYYSRQAPPQPQTQQEAPSIEAPDLGPQPKKKTTQPEPAPNTEKTPQANNQPNPQPTTPPPPSVKWLVLSSASFGFLAILFVVLFSTRKDQISDTKAFSEALDLHKQEIWTRASASPREVRRILNNIRLIAAGLPIPPPEPPNYLRWAAFIERLYLRLIAAGLPFPPPKPHTYARWAAFIQRLHRRILSYTPPPKDQPFSPSPGDIPALVLNYPASTSPQLTEWYEKECRSLGFQSPDHFIRNIPAPPAPPRDHFDFS